MEQTYEERKQELFRFLYVLLGDKQSAEDALQDTFLKAYLHRSKYVEMQQEKAWLYQIARNTAYDMLRKRRREFPIEKEQINDAIEKVVHHEDIHEHLIYMEMIGNIFVKVLECAEVFKRTEQGVLAFKRFLSVL